MKVKDIRPGGFYLFDASNQWEIPPLDEAEGQVEVLEVGVNRVVIEDGERHVRGDGILVRFHGEDGTVRDEIVPPAQIRAPWDEVEKAWAKEREHQAFDAAYQRALEDWLGTLDKALKKEKIPAFFSRGTYEVFPETMADLLRRIGVEIEEKPTFADVVEDVRAQEDAKEAAKERRRKKARERLRKKRAAEREERQAAEGKSAKGQEQQEAKSA